MTHWKKVGHYAHITGKEEKLSICVGNQLQQEFDLLLVTYYF